MLVKTELDRQATDLLDLKDEKIDPLASFMTGPRRKMYDDIRNFFKAEKANSSYLGNDVQIRLRAVVNDTVRRFENQEYRDCLNKVISWKPAPSVYLRETKPLPPAAEPIIESISKTIRQVAFDKPILADEHDVECYVDRLKKRCSGRLTRGKRSRFKQTFLL